MITPLVDDAVWLPHLSGLPQWQPPPVPTLVLAPHPDDETLGAGALIATLRARGVPVTVVAATDGENCYDISQDERDRIRQIRETEQLAALAVLGVAPDRVVRLRLRDSGLHTLGTQLAAGLREVAEPGMHLVAPWAGDFHPDHAACADAAALVATELALPLTSYFFWTWHRGTPALLDGLAVCRLQPDAAALRQKTAALLCHTSQLERAGGDPILPGYLLGPARWPFEVFLPA